MILPTTPGKIRAVVDFSCKTKQILSHLVESELKFWFQNCLSMTSKLISPIQSKPERIVFADASSFAGVGFVELNGKHTVVHSNCDTVASH
jgi:hypothetical protein